MNVPEPATLETQVIDSLQSIRKKYLQIDGLAKQMLAKQELGTAIRGDLDTLQSELGQLHEMQRHTQPLRDAYQRSQPTASESVKQLTDETVSLIQSLLLKIATLEESAKESRRQLGPEIDQNVRGKQMKQAYGATTR